MKTFKTLLNILLAVFLMSCQEQLPQPSDHLPNTTWVTCDQLMNERLGGDNVQWLKFHFNGLVTWEHTRNGSVISTEIGEYKANGNKVEIKRAGGVFTFDRAGALLISRDLQQLDGSWRSYVLITDYEF